MQLPGKRVGSSVGLWLQAAPFVVLLGCIFLNALHVSRYSTSTTRVKAASTSLDSNCDSLLKHGRYIDDLSAEPTAWQPDGCAMRHYDLDPSDLFDHCFSPGDEIVIVGDSTARQVFWGMVDIFERGLLTNFKIFKNKKVEIRNVTLSFLWSPRLKGDLKEIANITSGKAFRGPDGKELLPRPKKHLISTAGLWFGLNDTLEEHYTTLPRYQKSMEKLFGLVDKREPNTFDSVYFAPLLVPTYLYIEPPSRRVRLSPELAYTFNNYTDDFFEYRRDAYGRGFSGGVRRTASGEVSAHYVPVFNEIHSDHHFALRDQGGLHFMERGFYLEANILLNHMCNAKIASAKTPFHSATCCVPAPVARRRGAVDAVLATVALGAAVVCFSQITRQLLHSAGGSLATRVYRAATMRASVGMAARVALGTGVAVLYSWVVNETGYVSFVRPHFGATDLALLLQLWAAASAMSYSALPQQRGSAQLILEELRGACVLLLLIVNISGYDKELRRIEGEIFARILVSVCTAAHIYDFTAKLLSASAGWQTALAHTLLSLGRILFLPTFLDTLVLTPAADSTYFIKRLSANNFWNVPTKLAFWYVFAAVGFACAGALARRLTGGGGAVRVRLALLPLALLLGAGLMVRPVVQLREQHGGPLLGVCADYWAQLAVVAYAWYAHHGGGGELLLAARAPSRRAVWTALGVALACVNIVFTSFGSFFPRTYGTYANRTQFEMSQAHHDLAVDARGARYSDAWHCVLTLALLGSYLVLRRAVAFGKMQGETEPRVKVVLLWQRFGAVSGELLVLRTHIVLARGASVVVHLLPTGIVQSTSLLRALHYLPSLYPQGVFHEYALATFARGKPYLYGLQYVVAGHTVVQACRRAASVAAVMWAAYGAAWASAGGWAVLEGEGEEDKSIEKSSRVV